MQGRSGCALEKTQWLSEQELQQLQLKLLKKLIHHCYTTVPYYKNLMDKRGIREADIETTEDIKLFPIINKEDVLQAGASIFSTKYPRWLTRTAHTGGTTGTPMAIQRSLFSIANEHAFVRRQWDWARIGFGDRCAYLTGRLIMKPDQKNGKLYAYDPIMKELILSTYHLSPKTVVDYAKVMKKYKVKAIVGYPSAVHLLARVCLNAGIKLELHAALTSSETLVESMRETIAEAFHCKVFDFYGSAERVCYIFTCEEGSYHLIPEYGLTELIPVGTSDDSQHKVISTGFWNLAMPLIRYDLGDIVVKSNKQCYCGRTFQVIKSITGRKGDVIKTPSGREFGTAILTHLLYGTNHIVESQIIQKDLGHIIIEYVPSDCFSKKDFESFKTLIVRHLPSELKIDLKQVEAVSRTGSGKIQPVVSQLTD
jgi:phenylacetate-CoA ligase